MPAALCSPREKQFWDTPHIWRLGRVLAAVVVVHGPISTPAREKQFWDTADIWRLGRVLAAVLVVHGPINTPAVVEGNWPSGAHTV
jgi:anti-sigma-K factor RskA